MRGSIERILSLETSWTEALKAIEKIRRNTDDKAHTSGRFEKAFARLFAIDHDLARNREQFLSESIDHPTMRPQLEPLAASIRRLQRISDRLQMVENPENFPEQADLKKIQFSRLQINTLRSRTDALVDSILIKKPEIDQALSSIVENYSPARIDPVDRAILRLGAYEIMFTDTPARVCINEAIELAKRFGNTDSHRFVNGLLDKLVKSKVI